MGIGNAIIISFTHMFFVDVLVLLRKHLSIQIKQNLEPETREQEGRLQALKSWPRFSPAIIRLSLVSLRCNATRILMGNMSLKELEDFYAGVTNGGKTRVRKKDLFGAIMSATRS